MKWSEKRVKKVLEDAIRNVMLDTAESHRVATLMIVGKAMEKLADETKVRALVEEEGPERIKKARKVMDEALEVIADAMFDDPGDCVEIMLDEMSEHERLSEALNHLDNIEEDSVTCKLCKKLCIADTAHRHGNEWIGDECCWDERLKATE